MCLQGMVCSLNKDNQILCSILDTAGNSVSFFLPVAETVDAIFQEISKRWHFDPNAIELKLRSQQNFIVLNDLKQKSLLEAGLRAYPDQNDITSLPFKDKNMDKEIVKPLIPIMSPTLDDSGASPPAAGDMAPIPKAPPPPTFVQPAPWHEEICDFSETPSPAAVPYVGLVNQAMTCYLNSLLQALFMTPEFRNALYRWEFDGSEEEQVTSIPYQLQKLFLNLQTSTRASVETTALTRSFGWQQQEVWQQHDIQELCRGMFDALEKKFKDTDQADLINRLYEGTMTDYVKCLECSTEKSREDKFLDIPLTVRPFGSAVAYGSVEEALRAFVQPETLEGNNQYLCERCDKKCDAHKGLKFKKFPYILTLHLKRFDFDYSTMNRIKLNDKVSFPENINLNGFVPKMGGDSPTEVNEEAVKCDDSSTTDSGSALDEDNTVDTPSTLNHTEYQEDDEGIDVCNTNENEKNRFNASDSGEPGPYVYELFSIMIHSGSASGGHYYAYIKDFSQGEWFCFNDQSVTRITQEDIKRSFGGGRGYYSGVYSPSTNAYMLMYRQIDNTRNATPMTPNDFPPHIHKLLKRIEEQKESELRIRQKEQEMIRFKCYHQPENEEQYNFRVVIHRDATLRETLNIAVLEGNLDTSIPIECCRLVSYDPVKGTKGGIECSFEGKDNELFKNIRENVYKPDFLLEVRKPDEQFKVYRIGDITTKVMLINPLTQEVESPIPVRANKDDTIAKYIETVAQALKIDPDQLLIYLEPYSRDPFLLESTNKKTLHNEGMYNHNRVLAMKKVNKPVTPKSEQFFQLATHIITLHMTLPTVTKEDQEEFNCEENAWIENNEHDELSQPQVETEEQLAGTQSDQSASEDSSLTDSERTLIGDTEDPSPEGSPRPLITWDNDTTDTKDKRRPVSVGDGLGSKTMSRSSDDEAEDCRYFRAERYQDGTQLMLKVKLDKRITIKQLKSNLQQYVGVGTDYFKIYRVSNGLDSKEFTHLSDTLQMLKDDDCMSVQLGKALRQGECPGKVFLLDLKATEPTRFLFEWAIPKLANVNAVKREILAECRRKCNIEIPFGNCRLRLKKWTYPSRPYLNDSVIDDINDNWELYIQDLNGPEPFTKEEQRLFFVRQWSPSTMTLGPFHEIVIDTKHSSELKQKISTISEIPIELIEIATCKNKFPCNDLEIYSLHSDMNWMHDEFQLDGVLFDILDLFNEFIIIFKNKNEPLKVMKHEERKEISQKRTNSSLGAVWQRKERGLKIYVDSPPPRRRDENDVD